jgi:acyl dehydratase
MRVFESLEAFTSAVGSELGTSEWFAITQERIDQFAEATGDRQWIHVDPDRAALGPFGTTIAHGYLTLSLVPTLANSIYRIEGLSVGVNYGADKVRFPHPVPVGSRVRETATLTGVTATPSGVQARITFVVEVEGVEKPACVAEVVYLLSA